MSDHELVLLTAPHRRPMTFMKKMLINYQISCYKNYEKLARRKLRDKAEAEHIDVHKLSVEDQEIIASNAYIEFVEKGLDLANSIFYPAKKSDDDHSKVDFSFLSKPLLVYEIDYDTRAIGDPTNYQKYLEDFIAFNGRVGKDDKFMNGDFEEIHKIHQAISYVDHIEYRKKLSIEMFKDFSKEVGLKSQNKSGGSWFSWFGR